MRSLFGGGRKVRALGGATVALALMGLAACDYPPDGDPDSVTYVGSDTTQDVMEAIAGQFQSDAEYNADPDTIRNINAQQNPAESVPGDEHCGTRSWGSGGTEASPNGSSAGRNRLRESVLAGDGCVDIARSSSGPRAVNPASGDLESFEYYAFGLDAVGWSSASPLAPNNITQFQLLGIYNCAITNWSQVGGQAGPIQRYWPQDGSGTRSFAQSDLLVGFDPTTVSNPNCPPVILTQENSGTTITANGHREEAIVPYSAANWIAQANDVVNPDQRSAQRLRGLNGQNPVRQNGSTYVPGTPVVESNVKLANPSSTYPGIRYVFNVVDYTSPSYDSAIRYAGFDNVESGNTSKLCSGGKGATIRSYGFGTLDKTVSPRNQAGSNCRVFYPS